MTALSLAGVPTRSPGSHAADAASAFALLPTISLTHLLEEAALQTRVDRKYLVPRAVLGALASADPAARVLEVAGRTRHAYASRYEDTLLRESYLLAAHGRPARYKVRTRTYCDSGLAFLEVKTRSRRGETVKDRLPLGSVPGGGVPDGGVPGDVRRFVPATVRHRTGIELGHLHPVLDVRYERTTLFLPGAAARVTIDEGLTWAGLTPGTAVAPGIPSTLALGDLAIVETKSAGHPSPVDHLLWRLGHRPVRLSKYACGMALLSPDLPANRWHRTLTRLQAHLV